jgi:hypothetical protein
MDHRTTVASRSHGRRALLLTALSVAALALSGLVASSASAESTWVCRPGLVNNPCLGSEEATVELPNGSSFIEKAKPAKNPPIDCFYVYGTVSSQLAQNANEEIDPEETVSVQDEAERFSQVCNVYAPIYPQITVAALNSGNFHATEAGEIAFAGVVAAFEEYLAKYNDGRGFELIGHSQGASMLEALLQHVIEPNPALRSKLVGAILAGGNIIVPEGKTKGGTFAQTPACQIAGQTGCLVAYSTFLHEPPNPSDFGRVQSALFNPTGEAPGVTKPQVLCVNPTVLLQGRASGPALSYYSTTPFPGLLGPVVQVPKAATPWVAAPDEYSAQCQAANGASWLQLTPAGPAGDQRERLLETLGPEWGTHLADVNVVQGNLVAGVGLQALTYTLTH